MELRRGLGGDPPLLGLGAAAGRRHSRRSRRRLPAEPAGGALGLVRYPRRRSRLRAAQPRPPRRDPRRDDRPLRRPRPRHRRRGAARPSWPRRLTRGDGSARRGVGRGAGLRPGRAGGAGSRRSGRADVHLGDDRALEGGAAQSRAALPRRRLGRLVAGDGRGRRLPRLAAALPHRRPGRHGAAGGRRRRLRRPLPNLLPLGLLGPGARVRRHPIHRLRQHRPAALLAAAPRGRRRDDAAGRRHRGDAGRARGRVRDPLRGPPPRRLRDDRGRADGAAAARRGDSAGLLRPAAGRTSSRPSSTPRGSPWAPARPARSPSGR